LNYLVTNSIADDGEINQMMMIIRSELKRSSNYRVTNSIADDGEIKQMTTIVIRSDDDEDDQI
jgi:hypothetical protein